jgi:hypothetical protein
VLSHDHRDHGAALDRLIERVPVRLWAGPLRARRRARLPPGARAVDLALGRAELALPARTPLAAALVRGGRGSGNEGSRSLVLALRPRRSAASAGERVVLSGDAEGEGLGRSLADGTLRGPSRLLLLPHHGSDTPLLGALLERLDPELVWASAEREPPIAGELARRGLPLATTARDGWLRLRLTPRAGPRSSPVRVR